MRWLTTSTIVGFASTGGHPARALDRNSVATKVRAALSTEDEVGGSLYSDQVHDVR
jgi:hypothetical protein